MYKNNSKRILINFSVMNLLLYKIVVFELRKHPTISAKKRKNKMEKNLKDKVNQIKSSILL